MKMDEEIKKLGRMLFQKSNEQKWKSNRRALFENNRSYFPRRKKQSYLLLKWFQKNKSITVAQCSKLFNVPKTTAYSVLDSFCCDFGLIILRRGKVRYYVPKKCKSKMILNEIWKKRKR